ncbi:hypothetical protein BU23DRAFT_456849, partial [Bimuria novae-zelandiae CBS 107.79]
VYNIMPGEHVTKAALGSYLQRCEEIDDVYSDAFLEHIVFYGAREEEVSIDEDAKEFLNSSQFGTRSFVEKNGKQDELPSGPYVVGRGKTWQPWRAHHDTHSAMTLSLKPTKIATTQYTTQNPLIPPKLTTPSSLHHSFLLMNNPTTALVPSRCTSHPTPQQPLHGLLILVKDIFAVASTKTTLCNRAWTALYPPAPSTAPSTAPCIQTLLNIGAILLGKTKLNAMIVREETMECVDESAPWNPQGDGYQSCSGSSSGSAAAVGAYTWVDFAVGSDNAWENSGPQSVEEDDLSEYLKEAGTLPYYCDSYDQLASFRDDYCVKFGKAPFVHRTLRWRWEIAQTVTPAQHSELLRRLDLYKSWLLTTLFRIDRDGNPIVALPIEDGTPTYRDADPPPFTLLSGYSPLDLSPIAGMPEVTAPVGEITYFSEVTQWEEPLPTAVLVAGKPGILSNFHVGGCSWN